MTPLIPAITIKATLAGFAALSLDTEALLAPTGYTYDDLDGQFAAVPDVVYQQVWMAAFSQLPDPTLATQAGLAVPFNEFGLLDHLVNTADNVAEGLQMLNLFLWLVSTGLSLRFTHDDGDWVWVESSDEGPGRFISEQWTLAIMLQRFTPRASGFAIEEVRLSQEVDVDPALYEQYWQVPVHLNQPDSGFRLADGAWRAPNTGADPLLKQTLRTVAEQVEIKQFEEAPLIYAIRTRLPEALARGAFSAEDVAAELGLAKRTLQRKLSAVNITFKELLDHYRQEQAVMMLQNGERDMGTVAYALGYNEQSSFNRAFRRWMGTSPSNWLQSAGGRLVFGSLATHHFRRTAEKLSTDDTEVALPTTVVGEI